MGEALAYVEKVVSEGVPEGVQTLVLPTHTALAAVRDAPRQTFPCSSVPCTRTGC